MSKTPDPKEMGVTYQIADLYSKKVSMTTIKQDLNVHQEEVRRHIQRALKWFVENYERLEGENGEDLLTEQKETLVTKET